MKSKLVLSLLLVFVPYSLRAWEYSDIVKSLAVLIGFAYPTEIVDGIEREVLSSYQANSILQKYGMSTEISIEYKKFKTAQEEIQTKHIIDGFTFEASTNKYIVRSSLYNSNKVYDTVTTLFGSKQVVLKSQEAIAVINDSSYLTYSSYTLTGFTVVVAGKIKSGTLIDGSSFTANGINYIVKN